nr:RNA-directed DNA polymerase, eukaryota [Tanacetum cinerariifolium]
MDGRRCHEIKKGSSREANKSFQSNEDLTRKISFSVFVTNFPEHFSSQDLWNVWNIYGKVIDVYIPQKKSKAGKKFAFVRFINVKNWIASLITSVLFGLADFIYMLIKSGNSNHMTVDDSSPAIVLDDSCVVNNDLSNALMGKIKDINALPNLFSLLENEGFEKVNIKYLGGGLGYDGYRLVWVSIEGLPSISWTNNTFAKIVSQWGSLSDVEEEDDSSLPFKKICIITKPHILINNKIKVIVKGRVYWVRVKELEVWTPDFNCQFRVKVGDYYSRSSSWEEIIDKISVRLSRWKLKSLSIGGRLTLVKSLSITLYHMSIYKVPIGVLNKMESIRQNFFNGAEKNDRILSMFGWKKVLASKHKGGLGVSSFLPSIKLSFLNGFGDFTRKIRLCGLDLLKPCMVIADVLILLKKVGNGDHTCFWEDVWLDDRPLKLVFTRLYSLECDKKVTVSAKLNDRSLASSFRRVPRGGVEEEQHLLLVEKVAVVILSNSNDRWIWSIASSGEFSVKSTRKYIDDTMLPLVGSITRWVHTVPIKINILALKVCLDILPTRFNLSLRGLDIPSILCSICHLAGESSSHLFFSCNVARQLYQKIARWWELDLVDFYSYDDWII